MKLYKEYLLALENLRKGGRTIKKAYFTSFNLSLEFFETYILPPLLEEEVPDNAYQYEDLNMALEKSNLDLKIFYDANMMQLNEQKRTILKFTPILMINKQGKRKGLFHPKVIYIENDKGKGILFVGSGNLTLSGWGRNVEAFQIVDIEKNSNLFYQIYNFFIDVEIQARLRTNRILKSVSYEEEYNFIYSFEDNSNNSIFLESMNANNSSKLYVWSPYFSESTKDNIDSIIKQNFPQTENVHIIPDLVGPDKKIRLKKKPESEKIKFYATKEQNSENMNHSKVWITDSKLGIGSYNFTKEALFGINFEAAIVRDVKNIELDLVSIDFIEMNDTELDSERLELNTDFDLIFDLVADWKARTFTINQIVGNEIEGFKVLLPSGKEYLKEELDNLSMLELEKIFRALIRNKRFRVKHKSKIVYEGIIFEKSTEGFREPIKVETINDLFISFLDKKEPFSSKKLKNRNINFDENNNDIHENQTDTSYLNYFNLFKGFENLKNKLTEIKSEIDLKHYCFTSGNSVSSIMVVIKEYKEDEEHHNLFTYLFIIEFNSLVKKINKIIKDEKFTMDKIQEIDNINLKLSKGDEKFLKAFYG